jgi:hypothetical protein
VDHLGHRPGLVDPVDMAPTPPPGRRSGPLTQNQGRFTPSDVGFDGVLFQPHAVEGQCHSFA